MVKEDVRISIAVAVTCPNRAPSPIPWIGRSARSFGLRQCRDFGCDCRVPPSACWFVIGRFEGDLIENFCLWHNRRSPPEAKIAQFFDTNIFLYAYDLDAPAKRAVALRLVEQAWASLGETAISFQVLQVMHFNLEKRGVP